MADSNTQLNWTEEQWNRVRQVVYEQARKTRVAGNLLPLYGPLDPDATFVRHEKVIDRFGSAPAGIAVDDSEALKLTTLQEFVYLKSGQVADPNLEGALLAFRRAAGLVARLEDEILFRGQEGPGAGPPPVGGVVLSRTVPQGTAQSPNVSGGQRSRGLYYKPGVRQPFADGNALVTAISQLISQLEKDKHFGPFHCVLGPEAFDLAQRSDQNSHTEPHDRILGLLGGGNVVRSSSLDLNWVLVIAPSGEPLDLVVAKDISVSFLHVTSDPLFVFRVSEKIVLRINQVSAIAMI